MNYNTTPLRYPGGKSVLTNFLASIMEENGMNEVYYIEPYCGGAGAATNLLLSNKVAKIYINDLNYSIYSFWYSLKHFGLDFLDLFDRVDVTLDEWQAQRLILKGKNNKTYSREDLLTNGFATFFLNRCNRSGILKAGPIGGQGEQAQNNATYKLDARFNKIELRKRLENIINVGDRMEVYNLDALEFLTTLANEIPAEKFNDCLAYLDPPYYVQGSSLYLNFYNHQDHADIARYLSDEMLFRWILSYDDVTGIRELYTEHPIYRFYINYSAHQPKLGRELLVHSQNLNLPNSLYIKGNENTASSILLSAG